MPLVVQLIQRQSNTFCYDFRRVANVLGGDAGGGIGGGLTGNSSRNNLRPLLPSGFVFAFPNTGNVRIIR